MGLSYESLVKNTDLKIADQCERVLDNVRCKNREKVNMLPDFFPNMGLTL